MAKGGSRKRLRNGLTPKENAFTKEIVKQISETGDINGTQAALKVYDTTDPKTAGVIASENLSKPSIKEQIELAMESQGLTSSTIMANLKKLAVAEPEKISGDTVLKVNVELLKLLGAYPDKKSTHVNVNLSGKIGAMGYDEARKELEALRAENDVIAEVAQVE
jgi:hypothetical protein